MYLVTVLPLSKKARTDVLSYFHSTDIPLGSLVEVPFRNKPMRALVTETKPIEDVKSYIKNASYQLKKVSKVLGETAFPKELFVAIKELSDFYVAPFSKVADDIIPEAAFDSILETPILTREGVTILPSLLAADLNDRVSWYKTRIRELFAQKKSLYVACPTEREAETLYTILSRGLGEYCVLIGSGLTKKKLDAAIAKIRTTEHPICIFGTASYVTLPRNDLDTIVIEHESSQNYRRVVAPFIDMRLFLELYGKARKLSVLFADTLPRAETYERYAANEITEAQPLTFHPELPEREEIIARERSATRATFRVLSEKIEEEMRNTLDKNSRVFIFALRNGLASMTACRDCGEILTCEQCGTTLALYKTGDKRVFVCKACKRHAPSDSACKRCGSWNLHAYGTGVETVFDECISKFPETKVFRLDKASVKNDKEARQIISQFEKTPNSILVGTELALHYLTEKVPMIGVASFDSLFYIPSYKVSERIVELITTLREKSEKLLAVQTIYPDDKLLTITSKPKLFAWYKEELTEREEFNYPPHATLIKVVGHFPKARINEARESLATELSQWTPDIFTGASAENKNHAKLVALIRLPKKEWWLPSLGKNTIDATLRQRLVSIQDSFTVLVNPEDLL